ncbi:MAG: YggS family pyridoxal phosphate-dependent enzyme [Bacteroidales bacterium]|nr:YggS family pyridoxal phosphate-dependent enzyme [Bacteroidales bacterium]
MSIEENIKNIKSSIPSNVTLIAVSKTKPEEDLIAAYNCGQRAFGENKAQEMKRKHENLPEDIQWHFIGHLQENKIKYIISYVTLIHSVDSLKLLKEINKYALKNNRKVDCLFEIDISKEESKFGLTYKEVCGILDSEDYKQLDNIRICGVMGIGSITDDREQTRKEFKELRDIFIDLKNKYFANEEHFKEISMGMTHDYEMAIEEGATIIRIGSKIFGARDYSKQ